MRGGGSCLLDALDVDVRGGLLRLQEQAHRLARLGAAQLHVKGPQIGKPAVPHREGERDESGFEQARTGFDNMKARFVHIWAEPDQFGVARFRPNWTGFDRNGCGHLSDGFSGRPRPNLGQHDWPRRCLGYVGGRRRKGEDGEGGGEEGAGGRGTWGKRRARSKAGLGCKLVEHMRFTDRAECGQICAETRRHNKGRMSKEGRSSVEFVTDVCPTSAGLVSNQC